MTFPSFIPYFVELLFVVFLIVAVRIVAGRWLGPGTRRLLWGLLILKALMPLTVATPYHPLSALAKLDVWTSPAAQPEPEAESVPVTGLASAAGGEGFTSAKFPREAILPDEVARLDNPAQWTTLQSTETGQSAEAASVVTDAESPGLATSVVAVLPAVWLLGAVALFGVAVWQNRTVIRNSTQNPVAVPDWVRAIFLDCRRQLRLRTTPGLIVSPHIPSPCLVGAFRPQVLIPELLVEQRTPEAETRIRHLLLHELTHLKQGDVWLAWLWTLALAVQWFNPLFWLLGRWFRFDCEAACDNRVLTILHPNERPNYGISLLHMLIDTTPSDNVPHRATPRFAPGLLGLAEPRSNLERRLTMMKSHRMPSLLRRLSAVVVLLLLATLCLTSYGQSKPPTTTPAKEAEKAKADEPAKADALTNAVDPYDMPDQKIKFFKAVGNTNELDEKKFLADQKAGGNLIQPFEKWATVVLFDKNKNGSLDWFEFDAYRQAMRKAVLAACDKNKDGKLTGDERTTALKLLTESKLVIKPEPERPVSLPPMFMPFGGGVPASAIDTDSKTSEQLRADFHKRLNETNARMKELIKQAEDPKLSDEEREDLRKAVKEVAKENAQAVIDFEKEIGMLDHAAERERAWKGLTTSMQDFLLRNLDPDGDGTLDDAKRQAAFDFLANVMKINNAWGAMMHEKDATSEQRAETQRKWEPVYARWQKEAVKRADPDADENMPVTQIAPEKWRALQEKSMNGQVRFLERFEKQVLAENGGKHGPATREALLKALEADMRERLKKADTNNNGILDPEEGEKFIREYTDEWLKEE